MLPEVNSKSQAGSAFAIILAPESQMITACTLEGTS